jgi:hypothetical protein
MNVEVFRATIDTKTKESFKDACKAQGRSMTRVLDELIRDFLKRNGGRKSDK